MRLDRQTANEKHFRLRRKHRLTRMHISGIHHPKIIMTCNGIGPPTREEHRFHSHKTCDSRLHLRDGTAATGTSKTKCPATPQVITAVLADTRQTPERREHPSTPAAASVDSKTARKPSPSTHQRFLSYHVSQRSQRKNANHTQSNSRTGGESKSPQSSRDEDAERKSVIA